MSETESSLHAALESIGEAEPRQCDGAIEVLLARVAAFPLDLTFTTPTKVTKRIDSVAKLYDMTSAGVPYSIREHTKRVIRHYEFLRTKHAIHSAGSVTPSEFRLLLAVHDIGKGITVQKSRGQSKEQHADTTRVIDAVAPALGALAGVLPLLRAAIDGDPLGEYLRIADKARRNAGGAARAVRAMCTKVPAEVLAQRGLDARGFYRELVLPFYASDAFSYGDATAGNGASAKDWAKKLANAGYPALVRELGPIDAALAIG
jgi:hypothetical protein